MLKSVMVVLLVFVHELGGLLERPAIAQTTAIHDCPLYAAFPIDGTNYFWACDQYQTIDDGDCVHLGSSSLIGSYNAYDGSDCKHANCKVTYTGPPALEEPMEPEDEFPEPVDGKVGLLLLHSFVVKFKPKESDGKIRARVFVFLSRHRDKQRDRMFAFGWEVSGDPDVDISVEDGAVRLSRSGGSVFDVNVGSVVATIITKDYGEKKGQPTPVEKRK